MRFLSTTLLLYGIIDNDCAEILRGSPKKNPGFLHSNTLKMLHSHYWKEKVKNLDIMGNKEIRQ
jgi:hypothetical protein